MKSVFQQTYRMGDSSKVDYMWCQFLSVCLEEGVSIAAGDRLIRTITPYMKFRTKMTMNRLMKKIRDWSCTPSSMICITMCPECSSENLPGQVFCLNCLRMEKLTRLIKGCSCKDCPGRKLKKKDQSENENENENENESEVFDESRIEEYRSSFCFHARQSNTGSGILYHSIISIVGDMASSGLLSCLCNTTYKEMAITATLCRRNKVMSNILGTNSISAYESLNVPVVSYLKACAREIQASGNHTDALTSGLEKCVKSDSIENSLYYRASTSDETVLEKLKEEYDKVDKATKCDDKDPTECLLEVDERMDVEEEEEATPVEGSNKAAPLNNVAKGVPERRYNIRRENERKSNPNRAPPKGGAAYDGEKEEGKKKKKKGKKKTVKSASSRYTPEDVELLIKSFFDDLQAGENSKRKKESKSKTPVESAQAPASTESMEEGPQVKMARERVNTILNDLNCKVTEKLVVATALSMWLNWNSPEHRIESKYHDLLMHIKSSMTEDQQERIDTLADFCRINGLGLRIVGNGNRNEMEVEAELNYVSEQDYARIRWERPSNDVTITDHVILLDLYVDSVVSYMASKCNNSLFVVNLMINNAPVAERNTKAFSHFLAVIQDKKDIKSALRFIIKDLSITGKNGVYLFHKGHWIHIRWAVTGIHGDTVAQEEMEELVNKKFMWNPCVFDHTCECTNVSGSEGLGLPQTVCAKVGQFSSWKLPPRNFSRFPRDSPYRFLSLANVKRNSSRQDTTDEVTREDEALRNLMKYLGHPSVLIPPAVSKSDVLSFREKLLSSGIRQQVRHIGETLYIDSSVIKDSVESIQRAYEVTPKKKSSLNPLCMDDLIPVPKENRYALDAMHHIPNVGVCLYRALHSKLNKVAKTMDTYIKDLTQKALKDIQVPNWVRHIAMERIRLIRQPWDKSLKNYSFVWTRMSTEAVSTANQTPPPSWLKPSIITPNGFKKTRNHDDILFLLCYFDYVFQDSMRVPFVFAAKQVIDCLGYLYNNVNDLDQAANVQTILDFFADFLLAIVPPSVGTISLHNSTHYLDSMRWFGPMKNHDCFGNERLLQLVKGNTVTSRNPIKTVEKRVLHYELCQILLRAKKKTKSVCIPTDEGTPAKDSVSLGPLQEKLMELTLENLTDDRAYSVNDSVPFPTSVDRILLNKQRRYPVNRDFSPEAESAKCYTEIRFNGERYYSAVPGDTVDTRWLRENSRAIGYLKLINGKIALFIVTGYVVMKVGEYLYPQAICKYIETDSSSSFIDTQHKRICHKKYTTSELKTCLISLYKLTMNKAFALYYEKAGRCGFALQTLCSRQSKPVLDEELFHPSLHNTRQQNKSA